MAVCFYVYYKWDGGREVENLGEVWNFSVCVFSGTWENCCWVELLHLLQCLYLEGIILAIYGVQNTHPNHVASARV